jgi:hypothetical protein
MSRFRSSIATLIDVPSGASPARAVVLRHQRKRSEHGRRHWLSSGPQREQLGGE